MPAELGRGYLGIGSEHGTYVKAEDAYPYALERCIHGTPQEIQEFRDMLVEWFYSGNWVKEE